MKNRSKVLIAGGAGYLGSQLSEMLLDAGYEVTVLDIMWFSEISIAHLVSRYGFSAVKVDLRRIDEVAPHLVGVDIVINLAGLVGDHACTINPLVTLSCNYLSTVNLAVLSKHLGVQRYIFASSCSVYGAAGGQILSEVSETNPVSLYAKDKLSCENALLELNSEGFHTTSLRLSTLYGLSKRMRYDLVLNKLAAQASLGEVIIINGGSQIRPFLHVKDAASAFLSVLRADVVLVSGQIFNVGDDEYNLSIMKVADLIKTILPATQVNISKHVVDRRDYHVTFKKIRNSLNYRPTIPILDGINEIICSMDNSKYGLLNDEAYVNEAKLKALFET